MRLKAQNWLKYLIRRVDNSQDRVFPIVAIMGAAQQTRGSPPPPATSPPTTPPSRTRAVPGSHAAMARLRTGIRIVSPPFTEPKPEGWTRFVCFSDTHGLHDSIPEEHRPAADVLLHGGDFTNTGELEQVESLGKWLKVPA